jgi:D-glycero-alpha-D-manno-heptose-7-phosphate kinase
MIISRTPFRISLFGGGTDYPAWFREHGGAVLGMAINKYSYVSIRKLPPFFDHRSKIVYSSVEFVKQNDEIQHPAVRGALMELGLKDGVEIHYDADLPARSGLGSSSSFTVGLLHAIHALQGRMVTKSDLGREAIRIEQDVLKEAVGCQDQLWAAFGGLNRINFSRNGNFDVVPIPLSEKRRLELTQSIMMFFTGFSRYATVIAKDQIANVPKRTAQLATMHAMVDAAVDILCDEKRPISDLGKLLHEGWRLKRELASSISTTEIDDIYEAGMQGGALGGKLLGAGGGGFMIFLVEPDRRQQVRERLEGLIHVPVNTDYDGSKIVLYQPNGL